MEKIKDEIIIISIVLIGILFLVMPIGLDAIKINENTLGFWGSYLGGFFSAFGVIFTTYWIIRKQYEKEDREFNNQVRITKNVLLQEVKIKQTQDIIQSLLNIKVNAESYFINIRKCLEYYEETKYSHEKYLYYSGIYDRDKARSYETDFYKYQNEYNKKLEENAKSLQILDKEINHIKAINQFIKFEDLQVDDYYKNLRNTLSFYLNLMDLREFEKINLVEIGNKELEYTNEVVSMLGGVYNNFDKMISDFEKGASSK